MSIAHYQELIRIAKDRGLLWPERCVRREDIASVEKKLGLDFSEQMILFYTQCGDLTIERRDVLFLDPNDTEDTSFNLLAVALEAREAGFPPYLLPFFNLCDDDGNIAYLDFSRMKDGEPLVTIAYFGTNGIVFTGKTDDDFGEYLLKKLNEDPLSDRDDAYHLTEGTAKALLEYWPSSEEQQKYNKNVKLPVTFFTVLFIFFIAFLPYSLIRYFGNSSAVLSRIILSVPLAAFCLIMIHFIRRSTITRDNYIRKAKEIGHEKLISQMTAPSAEVFFQDENNIGTFIVFTDDYAIFTYKQILRWKSIGKVTISDHFIPTGTRTEDWDTMDMSALPKYKAYKLVYDSGGGSDSEIVFTLYPADLERFIDFLRDKVPQVTALI
ncbi:MAG: SMI1/KNR4 family protein [Clostridiales bacterium]|nr:SMI1/KNR4 family protein [Clostridiales bacterium]